MEIDSSLTASTHVEQPVESRSWLMRCSIEAAKGQASFRTVELGVPHFFTRWFALVRISLAWLCPRQGRSSLTLKEDAIVISFLRNDGLHLVLLALSFEDVLTVFQSTEGGHVIINGRNDGVTQGSVRVVASVATSFEAAIAATTSHARTVIEQTSTEQISKGRHETHEFAHNVEHSRSEPWCDGFAYCTWNGLGRDLSEQKILSALNQLQENKISVSTLIVDDNWQSLDDHGDSAFCHRWTDMEANVEGFPHGLKHTTEAIRRAHPSLTDIAVWHGIFGYWNAVAPHGKIAGRYRTRIVKKQNTGFLGGGNMTIIDSSDVYRMYDDFYR